MRIYELYSAAFGSKVRLTYNESGILTNYQVMNEDITHVPSSAVKVVITEELFKQLAVEHKLDYVQIDRVITFEMFYERYAYKVDKPLAQTEWNKLLKEEQIAAYDFVPKYYAQLKLNGGLGKKYPVRYLKHKPWVQ